MVIFIETSGKDLSCAYKSNVSDKSVFFVMFPWFSFLYSPHNTLCEISNVGNFTKKPIEEYLWKARAFFHSNSMFCFKIFYFESKVFLKENF